MKTKEQLMTCISECNEDIEDASEQGEEEIIAFYKARISQFQAELGLISKTELFEKTIRRAENDVVTLYLDCAPQVEVDAATSLVNDLKRQFDTLLGRC